MIGFKELEVKVIKDYCCGCGVCTGVCPKNCLEMQFNKYGEYNPTLVGDCVDCGLCVKVCPFISDNSNEGDIGKELFSDIDSIKHKAETGFCLDSYVGVAPSEEMHSKGASGGMVTYLLCELLRRDEIDYVVTVSPNPDPDKLFKFVVVSTPESVQKCSKSSYYPVEVSEVLRNIQENKGRYAIVGLPCVCKAIRLAQSVNTKLKDRIKYVLGLVCGQQKSQFFAEYICAMGGGNPNHISDIRFRIKDNARPASDFGVKFSCSNGVKEQSEIVWWTEGMSDIWCNRYFTHNACNFCDDIFAECADVAFMDAWLPEYSPKPKGTSLFVDRIGLVNKLKLNNVKEICLEEVVKSQQSVIDSKRNDMQIRIGIAKRNGWRFPQKRCINNSRLFEIGRYGKVKFHFAISRQSGRLWLASEKNKDVFSKLAASLVGQLKKAERYSAVFCIPIGIVRRIVMKVLG